MDNGDDTQAEITLAGMSLENATTRIEESNRWCKISKKKTFQQRHLIQQRAQHPRIYSTILRSNNPLVFRFGVSPFRGTKVLTKDFSNRIHPETIASCDGVVALYSIIASRVALFMWNPYLNKYRKVTDFQMKQCHIADTNNLSLGFGKFGDLNFMFYLFFPTARNLVRYDVSQKATYTQALDQEIHLRGHNCDVTIRGRPYWRGHYGDANFSDMNARIFFPTENNSLLRMRTIHYPGNLAVGFSEIFLQEFLGNLGVVSTNRQGPTVNFTVHVYRNQVWEISHNGNFQILENASFWIRPNYTLLLQNSSNQLMSRNDDEEVVIGQYQPKIVNHVSSLVFY